MLCMQFNQCLLQLQLCDEIYGIACSVHYRMKLVAVVGGA